MSLIRNGYAVSTRRGFLGGLFSALLALALFDTGAAAAQEVKQIKLTENHIQGFMAAYDHIAKIYDGANPDKPDPKLEAQAGAIIFLDESYHLLQHSEIGVPVFEEIEDAVSGAQGRTAACGVIGRVHCREVNSLVAQDESGERLCVCVYHRNRR